MYECNVYIYYRHILILKNDVTMTTINSLAEQKQYKTFNQIGLVCDGVILKMSIPRRRNNVRNFKATIRFRK